MNGDYPVETMIEVVEDTPQRLSDIMLLESDFNRFKKADTVKTMKITETISMMELDTVKDLILDAKGQIESYTAGNTSSLVGKAKNKLVALPFGIGKLAQKSIAAGQRAHDEGSNINDVFKGLFDNFTIKQDRIIELASMLNKMKIKLEEQNSYVQEVIAKTVAIIEDVNSEMSEVMRAKRLNSMANTTLLKNRDKVDNKIAPGIMLASKSLDNMNQILPSLESDMLDELGINGALNSFKDMNIMLQETMELASSITEMSSKNTEELMLETMQIADTSKTVKYIEDVQTRRANFQGKFEKVMIESKDKQEANYQKVREIAENYTENSTLNSMISSYTQPIAIADKGAE